MEYIEYIQICKKAESYPIDELIDNKNQLNEKIISKQMMSYLDVTSEMNIDEVFPKYQIIRLKESLLRELLWTKNQDIKKYYHACDLLTHFGIKSFYPIDEIKWISAIRLAFHYLENSMGNYSNIIDECLITNQKITASYNARLFFKKKYDIDIKSKNGVIERDSLDLLFNWIQTKSKPLGFWFYEAIKKQLNSYKKGSRLAEKL